jgi:hypothetical protein
MQSPRISLLFWAIYALALGAGLLLVPEQVLGLLGFDEPNEVWVRVLGAVSIVLGFYYLMSTFNDARWFYRASVIGRWGLAVLMVFLAITAGPWQLLLTAVADFLGGLWTFLALRASGDRAPLHGVVPPGTEATEPPAEA